MHFSYDGLVTSKSELKKKTSSGPQVVLKTYLKLIFASFVRAEIKVYLKIPK